MFWRDRPGEWRLTHIRYDAITVFAICFGEMISEDWYTFDVMFITASGKCSGEIALASEEWLTLDVMVITVSGKCFGEIALMSEDATRNASIIADEETDLLVIHRDLFNSTIKVD